MPTKKVKLPLWFHGCYPGLPGARAGAGGKMWRVNCRDKHKSADDDGKQMEKSSLTEELLQGFEPCM